MAKLDCPRCGAIASVQEDRNVSGDLITARYTCGRCQHTWHINRYDARNGKTTRRVGTPDRRNVSRTDRRKSR